MAKFGVHDLGKNRWWEKDIDQVCDVKGECNYDKTRAVGKMWKGAGHGYSVHVAVFLLIFIDVMVGQCRVYISQSALCVSSFSSMVVIWKMQLFTVCAVHGLHFLV